MDKKLEIEENPKSNENLKEKPKNIEESKETPKIKY